MRPSTHKDFGSKAPASTAVTDALLALNAAELLLSMVEARWAAKNGDARKMDLQGRAQQELEKIEEQMSKLESLPGQNDEVRQQVQQLHARIHTLRSEVSVNPDPWRKAELARHQQRPHFLDYVDRIFTDWSEIHGDRGFGDDTAMVCGMARFQGQEVVVIGPEKGRDTKQRMFRNFGLPNPEGYRKALRVMKIAEKFSRPVITLVDVTGANPGLGAEERGQAEAIARNLREMARLRVPIVTAITGEGGSGGALAIAVADRVLMMENAIYSVISPEGCASIMWRDATKKELAAQALHITARDLTELGCVDAIIAEPPGGAHTDYDAAAALLGAALQEHLAELQQKSIPELIASRYNKFRNMAQFYRVEP
jgi:acetyl-CoA carboxylase carboxyl transferase subunit alpha